METFSKKSWTASRPPPTDIRKLSLAVAILGDNFLIYVGVCRIALHSFASHARTKRNDFILEIRLEIMLEIRLEIRLHIRLEIILDMILEIIFEIRLEIRLDIRD